MLVTNQRQYHKHNISSSIKFLLRNIISIENEVDIFIKVAKNSIDYMAWNKYCCKYSEEIQKFKGVNPKWPSQRVLMCFPIIFFISQM